VLLLAAGLAIWLGLDPWLRRVLVRQVRQQTHGQYQLSIGQLDTELLAGNLHLRDVHLRPATPTTADTLPRLTLRLARLDLTGVGLLAALRGRLIPADSLVLDSLRVQVQVLARRPAPHRARPFYEQRPVRLGYLALRHLGGSLGPEVTPTLLLPSANVQARDLLLTAAGAADTSRLAFAAAWQAVLRHPRGILGGHTITLDRLAFASESQALTADSLRIVPPAPGQGKPGAVRVTLRVPQVRVRGLLAARWQHQHSFQADSVVGRGFHLAFRPPAQAPPPLWQLLRPLARRSDIAHLAITDGYLAVLGVDELPVARHLVAVGHALRIDSAGGQPTSRRVLYATSWQAHGGELTARFDRSAYLASAVQAALDTRAGTVRLRGLQLRPTLTPVQLNLRAGYQLTQVSARLPELRVQGLDFGLLSGRSRLRIARVSLARPWLQLSSDGRGPLNPHRSLLTPEALKQLKLPLELGSLEVQGGTIRSVYRSPLSPRKGYFMVSEVVGSMQHISTVARSGTQLPPLTIEATALMGGRSRLHAWLEAPQLGRTGQHRIWGTLGPAPFSVLNSVVVPTQLLGFKDGQLQGASFSMQVNRQRITGSMRTTYSGLRFVLLNYKGGEIKKTLWSRLKSGAVNVVVRDQNPRPGGRFMVGDMASRRELRFSVFSAWRQGLVSGLLNSAGVPAPLARHFSEAQTTAPLPKAGH